LVKTQDLKLIIKNPKQQGFKKENFGTYDLIFKYFTMEHKIYQTKAPLNEVKTSDDRTFNIQMFLYHHL